MSDIEKCVDKKCPSRTLCYRFTAPYNNQYQSIGAFGRKKGKMRCKDFWGQENKWTVKPVSDKTLKRVKSEMKRAIG